MKNYFTDEELRLEIQKNEPKARALLNDRDKMDQFLQKLEKKLDNFPIAGMNLSDIPIMASMIKSYILKEYTDIPTSNIIVVLGSLIYFVSPLDLIPDGIPFVGYIDDAALIARVLNIVQSDLEKYKIWRVESGKCI